MSKQFSRGGRRGGIGGNNLVKTSSVGFKPRRSGPPAEEKHRQSVFDRLGTRRVNVNPNPSSSTHYLTPGDTSSKLKKNFAPKSSERTTISTGKDESERGQRGRSRSRSRSSLTKHRVKSSASTSAKEGRKVSLKSVVASSKRDKTQQRPSPSTRQQEISKIKSKFHKESSSSAKDRLKTARAGIKSKPTGKLEKEKRRTRTHTPSPSSEESGGESSSTTSSRSSTSTDGSSSSSSEGSSSSDSSVPSIKLKTVKKSKDKEIQKKRIKKKVQERNEKLRSKKEVTKKQEIRSATSSISSAQHKSHSNSERRNSPPELRRSTPRDHEFGDKRSSTVKSGRSERERDSDHFGRTSELESGQIGSRHLPPSRTDRYDESRQKRRISGENYEVPSKRSRVDTPPERFKNVTRRSPSPTSVRMQDSHMYSNKGERTLLARGRVSGTSLVKRPAFEDARRNEHRRDMKPNYESPTPFMKSKNNDRERDRQFEASFDRNFDSSNYNRGERHQERFAPSREAPHPQGSRERIPPPQQKDRRIQNPPRDIEITGRRAPLLPFPSDVKPMYQYHQTGPSSSTANEPYKRGTGSSTFRKRSPLIVKTKEALIEKYEDNKLSRVDMWVDETVRGGPTKRQAGPSSIPRIFPDEGTSSTTLLKEKRSSSIGSENALEKGKDLEDDQLSDFSDDADDILTKESAVNTAEVERNSPESNVEPDAVLKDTDSDTAKVTSSNLREEIQQTKIESNIHQHQSTVNVISTDIRTVRSQSQSQTDDDLLERMDFEEISDEELGEGENKIGIVDALGVDWSSLVCREKTGNVTTEGDGVLRESVNTGKKLKDKWSAANILKQVGLSRQLAGDKLFEKVLSKIQDMEERNGLAEKTTTEELKYPNLRRKRLERKHLLDHIGIGPYSRVLSSRRDLAVRRYLLNMTPRSLVTLDMPHQTPAPISQLEVDYVRSYPQKLHTA